jgi:hypothetical protein
MTKWIESMAPKAIKANCPEDFTLICVLNHTTTHDGVVVPAELALVKFNLVDGIKAAKSFVIKNKETWVKENAPGSAFKMLDRAVTSHHIPVKENFPIAEDISTVVEEIMNMIGRESEIGEWSMPPVFTINISTETLDHITEDNMADVKFVLDYLFKEARVQVKPPLVYDFLTLFVANYKELMQKGKLEMINKMLRETLQNMMDQDKFQLMQYGGDCCLFHCEVDEQKVDLNKNHCALAKAKRWAYTMCDTLTAAIVGDEFIPQSAQHRPPIDGITGIRQAYRHIDQKVPEALKMMELKIDSMNGNTKLPTSGDPEAEVTRQLRENMNDVNLNDRPIQGEDTEFYSFNESRLDQADFPPLIPPQSPRSIESTSDVASANSAESRPVQSSTKSSRLFARF